MLPVNGLYGHIRKHALASAGLLLGFVVLMALFWLSWCVIYSAVVDHWLAQTPHARGMHDGPTMAAVFASGVGRAVAYWWMPLFLSSCWFFVAFLCYADIIRNATGSRAVTRKEQPRLYNIVEKTAIAAGLPMPRVEIMRSGALNAYAAGMTPQTSVVAITYGLMQSLTDAELEAVVAHEMAHIKNHDVRLMVIATVAAGGLTLIGSSFAKMLFGDGGATAAGAAGAGGLDVLEADGEGAAIVGTILVAVVFLCLVHLFAILIRLAISRSREFMADAGAVEITKDADALISALQKIEGNDAVPGLNASLRPLMISAGAESLFSTHPATADRIAALQVYAGGRVPGRSVFDEVSAGTPLTAVAPRRVAAGRAAGSPAGAMGFGRRRAARPTH